VNRNAFGTNGYRKHDFVHYAKRGSVAWRVCRVCVKWQVARGYHVGLLGVGLDGWGPTGRDF